MIAQNTAVGGLADVQLRARDFSPAEAPIVPRQELARQVVSRRIGLRARPRSIHRIRDIHTRRNIDAILHRECARSERNGHEFCVVVVWPADNGAPRQLSRLAKLLCQRTRATDEVGWFEKGRLCVVLPDTSEDGAMAFVRDFSQTANQRGISPICNVLGYRGQMHSDNEPVDAEQIARGMDDAGEDIAPADLRSFASLRNVSAGDIASLLVKPLPWWKRFIDVTVGSTILLAALPVMGIAALAIKVSDGGPVFFRQRRAGMGGRPFTIFKFRTMVTDADSRKSQLRHKSEQDGPAFKIKHDPRITRIGRFLRETSIDELPQLFNVLLGDMSLVGPRPLPVEESNRCATWHRRRLDVTPGLTCIWQVHGRSKVTFAEWIRMDRRYIRAQSLLHDVKLILMTAPAIFLRRGR
jgi:lipopolysaccharide/colanic/teichoic acid biosynthesis glycosyltransferase